MLSESYTIVIATFNEEGRIKATIDNFVGRAKIILVDNFSTDSTCEIAERAGCTIFRHQNNGYWDKKEYEFMFEKVETEWFLLVYCGQCFSNELLDECEKVIASKNYDAIALEGRTIQYGKETNAYGKIRKRIHTVSRFAKKCAIDLGRYRIHLELPYNGQQERMFYPELRPPFLIYNFREDDFSMLNRKNIFYCNAEAAQRLAEGQLPSMLRLWSRPAIDLIKRLFWRKAILEGWRGISTAIAMSYRELFTQIAMFEQQHGCTASQMLPKNLKLRRQILMDERSWCDEKHNTEIPD